MEMCNHCSREHETGGICPYCGHINEAVDDITLMLLNRKAGAQYGRKKVKC